MARGGLDLSGILTAARQRRQGQRGRSPIYDLMWDHHDDLAPELNHPRRPNWQAVAKVLGEQGLRDGSGQALTEASAETVRKTWWKVSRDKEAAAAGTLQRQRKAVQPIQQPGDPAQPVQTAEPSMPASTSPAASPGMLPSGIEPPEEEPPKYAFKFAKVKDWTKATDKGDP